MGSIEIPVFRALLADVYARATGGGILPVPLSESEAKTLSQILENQVGRTISEKTLRNYVRQAHDPEAAAQLINPSPFHLETLARYVLDWGKNGESRPEGTPAWFSYRQALQEHRDITSPEKKDTRRERGFLSKPYRLKRIVLSVFFLSVLAIWVGHRSYGPQKFTEHFNHTSGSYLLARGWEVLDPDTAWLNRQLYPDSMLTLWTLPGDYWVKEGEPRAIKNMLVRRTEGDCFSVLVYIRNFNPRQASQQVALYLMDEHLNRQSWIRLGFDYARNFSLNKGYVQITRTYSENGKIINCENNGFSSEDSPGIRNKTQDVWCMMQVDGRRIRCFVKLAFDWDIFREFDNPLLVNFKPAYVGLAACQGWTLDDGTPKNADTIPAFIDYMLYEPCPALE